MALPESIASPSFPRPAPRRRLPVGADLAPAGGVHFRVWAPQRQKVEVVIEGCTGPAGAAPRVIRLEPEPGGYFSGLDFRSEAGTLYRFRLDDNRHLHPDPASRFQPKGPHGSSQVVDPSAFKWTDAKWPGVRLEGQIIYEMHIGTFTPEGTLEAASRELTELAATGITVIELMPVAEFPGDFGWGYDGVNIFAPTHLYGEPDDLRRFIDRAHATGLGVILDVVYNHLGPDGNYLREFSADYFTDRYPNEWGDAINFDGKNSGPVREFFVANAGYWIDEFHMDGLRLDATQQIFDGSSEHVIAAITRRVREAAGPRPVLLVGENEPEDVRLVKPLEKGGYGLDALWNDDYHHSARVAMTGHNDAYFSEYRGAPQELISAVKRGYLSQGQRYYWQNKRRGSPTFELAPATFVTFIQNHDQVANSAFGWRCDRISSPGIYRAITALTLLAPGTPMLFQGQEFAASSPFLYFADHHPELAKQVAKGRREFLSQFPNIATPEIQSRLPDPGDRATFEKCKLDFAERKKHAEAYSLHRDLLRLRREDPVFSSQAAQGVDGAVLGEDAFVVRFFGEGGDDRLLLVNLGCDLNFRPAQEPLLAPPAGTEWRVLWSSEDPTYGGLGTPQPDTPDGWRIRGHALVVLKPTGSTPLSKASLQMEDLSSRASAAQGKRRQRS